MENKIDSDSEIDFCENTDTNSTAVETVETVVTVENKKEVENEEIMYKAPSEQQQQQQQQQSFNINYKNAKGDTALLLAVYHDKYNIVELLLKDPKIDVNIQNKDGDTPLILAVQKNYHTISGLLVSHPAINVNILNNKGKSAYALIHDKIMDHGFHCLSDCNQSHASSCFSHIAKHPKLDIQNKNDALGIASYLGLTNVVKHLITNK